MIHSKHQKTCLLPLAGLVIALLTMVSAGKTAGQTAAGQIQDDSTQYSNVHFGLLYPLSTNGRLAGQYGNGFSFHLLMGLSREEQNFVLSGVSTMIRGKASGMQLAGVSNYTGNSTTGMQLGGVYNHAGDSLQGMQLGGVMNQEKTVRGIQLGGGVRSEEHTSELQSLMRISYAVLCLQKNTTQELCEQ